MVLATGLKVLTKADRGSYAVGAFNVNNMEILQGVVRAAEATRSPVFVQTSEGAIDYAGLECLYTMMLYAAESSSVPVVIHLDHGRDLDVVRKCIKIGYTSVMYDGSHLPFEENIATTRNVVRWAHRHGVSVEAELGTIGGAEDKVSARTIVYTEPDVARSFIERTGCDSLAIAIGTSHGAYKFAGQAQLDLARLRVIKRLLRMPLVLHGASGVPQQLVEKIKQFGGDLGTPEGVPDDQIAQAVRLGINKVNTDTDLRLAFTEAVRETLVTNVHAFDPRKIIGPARDAIQAVVEQRMKLFGSAGKA
ncbi:MAG: class II fructose-1,6-bisphosphate aldolase [Nanoarchaeota archaeon]